MTDAPSIPGASHMLTRRLAAPREQVWRAWTEPEELARWWWPERFRTTYEVDLREGGRYCFRTADLPDTGVLCVTGSYLEVRPPERLVYNWQWENDNEPATHVTVELMERGDGTEVRITHEGFATDEERENHVLGWTHCLDRLDRLLTVIQ